MPFRLLLALVALAWLLPAQAQTGRLDKIRQQGHITLGYLDGAAPFSFIDARGEPQGYSVDLCRAIAAGIGQQLGNPGLATRWVKLTIQNRLEAVREGRVDVECSTTTWTLSRQREVDFSLITFLDGASLLVREGGAYSRLADFAGRKVGVIAGTTTEKVLRAQFAQRSIAAEVVTVKTREEGIAMLGDNRVEGFASDRTALIGAVLSRKGAGAFTLLPEDFSIEQYALALPRGEPDFRLAVNGVLARLYRTRQIEPIYDRWLGPLGRPSLLLSATYFIQGIAE